MYGLFLFFAVAGVAGGAWLMSRKDKNLVLAWAFLAFSLLSITLAFDRPVWERWVCGGALAAFLLIDLLIRTAKKADPKKK